MHDAVNQWQVDAFQRHSATRRQTPFLDLVQIYNESDPRSSDGLCGKDADTARLDPASDCLGALRVEGSVPSYYFGLVISYKDGAARHLFQRQRRLAATGRAKDQHADWANGDATGMHKLG